MNKIQYWFLLLILSSCKPASEKVVNAVTGAILEPVTITTSVSSSMGEVEISLEEVLITVTVKNNSTYPIKNMNLIVPSKQTLLNFAANPSDLEGKKQSPGGDGTCGALLQPGTDCTYVLGFIPKKLGEFNLPVSFNYQNLIKNEAKDITFTGLIGEPASIFFTNEITYYDFGVIEKKYPVTKTLDIEIKNGGGLSARNMTYKIANGSPAFDIVKNECLTVIKPLAKCKITIGYTPRNNGPEDPEVSYLDRLSIEYLKNPSNSVGKLNTTFKFVSTRIEANFVNSGLTEIDFGKIITGNKETKTVTISNTGYREGILKEMIFTDYTAQENILAICEKATTGKILECRKSDGSSLPLKNFPFKVEDLDSCFEENSAGVIGKNPGKACSFKITYWPSTEYLTGTAAINYFNETKVGLKYDSKYEGVETLITKNSLFTILADFYAAGKLAVDKVEFDSSLLAIAPIIDDILADILIGLPINYDNNSFTSDLGRIALVKNSNYKKSVKITIKNIGESTLTFNSITDDGSPKNTIGNTAAPLNPSNPYYLDVKHTNCTILLKNTACTITFSLAAVSQSDPNLNDTYMFDYVIEKYKRFIFKYRDGSTFLDPENSNSSLIVDGSVERTMNLDLKGLLIKKGLLVIEPSSLAFSDLLNGQSETKVVNLYNAGTGPVTAIIKDTIKNLDPIRVPEDLNWPYEIKDTATALNGANYDCFEILKPVNSTLAGFPATPLPAQGLPADESCSLSIANKLPETARVKSYSNEFLRPFHNRGNGDQIDELWEKIAAQYSAVPLSFDYYDGDHIVNVNSEYGAPAKTNTITLASKFSTPANITVGNPSPTTAVIIRPSENYPSLTSQYPKAAQTIAGFTSNIEYLQPPAPTNPAIKHAEALTYAKTISVASGAYHLHAGTFPRKTSPGGAIISSSFSFRFTNSGQTAARGITLTRDSGTNNIQAQAFSTANIASAGTRDLSFNFNPSLADGVSTNCYTLRYLYEVDVSSTKDKSLKFCVSAEAIEVSPQINIQYSDFSLNGSAQLVDSNSFQNLATSLNSFTANTPASFSAIRGSAIYSKKRIRMTNVGGVTASNLKRFMLNSATMTEINPVTFSDITITDSHDGVTLGSSCLSATSLAANGGYCEYYIQFKPTTSSATTVDFYLTAQFEIKTNQFVSHAGVLKFSALNPAILSLKASVREATHVDWSNPSNPTANPGSYPVNIGNNANLTTFPTVHTVFGEIENSSAIKASFLNLNPSPSGAWSLMYSSPTLNIHGSLGCFYGDDLSSNPISGFNNGSINKCNVRFDFSGYINYPTCNIAAKTKTETIGLDIFTGCNPHAFPRIKYYNFERIPDGEISFHMIGSLNPNQSSATSTTIENKSVKSGQVKFSWTALTPDNINWGPITKYRVYYSTSLDVLNGKGVLSINSSVPYVETLTNEVTISSGLVNNTYYHFKVFAIRSLNGLQYVSRTNIDTWGAPIPGTTQIYNTASATLIDKAYKAAGPITRQTALSTCQADYYTITKNGVPGKVYKQLVSTSTINYVKADPTYNTGYEFGVGIIPHWVSDGVYDIANSTNLYPGQIIPGFPNFNNLNTVGDSPANRIIYFKDCTTSPSCNLLYKIAGGEAEDEMYENGAFYTTDNLGIEAYARCQAYIP